MEQKLEQKHGDEDERLENLHAILEKHLHGSKLNLKAKLLFFNVTIFRSRATECLRLNSAQIDSEYPSKARRLWARRKALCGGSCGGWEGLYELFCGDS